MREETVHLLAGKKKLKDEYKDPGMLSKVNKANMAGMMEAINEYIRSCCGIVRAPLAYFVSKTIIVQNYGHQPMCATTDDKKIAKMFHLPPGNKKLHGEKSAQSVKEQMTEHKIDNTGVYDILDQICKDTYLYLYTKQNKFKREDG